MSRLLLVRCLLVVCGLVMLQSCAAVKGRDIEAVEWYLSELGDTSVQTDAGVQSPELRFDPAQHQVSGFAGCNRFFGNYERKGTVLRFGPLATTRRACPDAESTLEMNFLDALARTRGWKTEADALLLLDDGKVLARLVSEQAVSDVPALESLVFHSRVLPTSPVTLAQGVYRVPAAPGSASEITAQLTDQRVFGVVNDVKIGAAILITATGGSGTYRELALLSGTAAGWVNTDTVLLGDRVQVQALAIEGDAIVVSLMTHGPDDPQCCPTQAAQKRYTMKGDHLVPASTAKAMDQPHLVGPVWQWMETRYNNDTIAAPTRPEDYTVQFLDDGRVSVKADCNMKGGTYSDVDRHVSVKLITSTMAACESGSLEETFVRDITSGTRYLIREGSLYIDLPYDTGTMKFTRRR